jgi:predicted AlkP superfamily phosphohydrolase/phosphomutase
LGSGFGVKEDDYLAFVLKLQRELLDLRDPASGEPVVIGADLNKLRGSSFVEPCPDITLRLRDGGFVSILKSKDILVQRPEPDGTHRPAGIFVASGPSFRRGETIAPLSLLDMTPLMLTLLGLSVPSDLEGRVPTEALAADRTVETGAATMAAKPSGERDEPSEEERQALMNQLKILGYMD